MKAKWIGVAVLTSGLFAFEASLQAQQVILGLGDLEDNCRPEIEEAIADVGVLRDEIQKIEIVEITQTANFGDRVTTGWNGWMRPIGVQGYLVVQVSRHCVVRDVYTRGEYQIEGVPRY